MDLPDKYKKIEQRYNELEQQLADPHIIADQSQYQKIAKEYSNMTSIVNILRAYENADKQIEDLQKLLKEEHDDEFEELATSELGMLSEQQQTCLEQLNDLTNPKKQQKDRDLIIEIRAGTGGQEASLFAADLYRMYVKYADQKNWTVEAISSNESETGGFKEVIFSVSGRGAEQHLQFESGAHRVQRVPETEASGRIHTSAATVAALPEAEEVDVDIADKDIRVDVYRASGPGGQSVNTTDSAVRITHFPTGLIVTQQDEKSQHKNRAKAMKVLRSRLYELERQKLADERAAERKGQVGSGDRSERIRTYNYPQGRVSDHRINLTLYKLDRIVAGDGLEEMIEALITDHQAALLSDLGGEY